jgi:hypothetical protein
MSEMQQGFQRNAEYGKHGDARKGSFRDDVAKLFQSSDCNEYKALAKLRNKYSDERIVQEKFAEYKDSLEKIKKKAFKFKEQLYNKYGGFNLPFPVLVKKAKKFIKKYGFSEEEFDCFLRFALSDSRMNQTNIFNVPNTEMSKALGYSSVISLGDKLHYKEDERVHLETILKLYESTRHLHEQLKLQTITYTDTATQALTGNFIRDRHNPYTYVHPVIAALFLPKVRYLEEVMLLGNIGNIIKLKKDGYPITTKPDYELYWAMISDPNDMACAQMRNSPLRDLELRYRVQTKLWESVIALRQGRFYDEKLTEFLQALDKCPNNLFDAPDLSYVRDEGTILRKLLGVFSIRPTVVNIIPEHSSLTGYTPLSITSQITSIPMMTMYLPPRYSTNVPPSRISFNIQLNQQRWFIQNKMIVPKTISIVYSRDVFFLYVPRRFYNMDFAKYTSPFTFSRLPVTLSGTEKLNDSEFGFEWDIDIFGNRFELRSVVFVDVSKENDNIIIGTSAGIVSLLDPDRNQYIDTCYVYSPQDVYKMAYDHNQGLLTEPSPLYYIEKFDTTEVLINNIPEQVESFVERAVKRGTIFMYAKEGTNKLGLF